MITVRFPSGFSIQYNDACYTFRESQQTLLYESSKKEKLIAIVPNGCAIEHKTPCRMYNPLGSDSDSVQAEVSALRSDLRSLTRKVGKIGGPK